MRVLAISDQILDTLYSGSIEERFGDVDLAVSYGELPYSYLEHIVTMLNVPCFYVHGNHDHPECGSSGIVLKEPGGWVNLDGRSVEMSGLVLTGLEGSIRYKPHASYQYTERQMAWKLWRMVPKLLSNRVRHGRYLDVLVTHSPPFGIHDGKDNAHRGFEAFFGLMKWFKPRYLLHGHKHVYGTEPTETHYAATKVVNICPYRVIRC